PHRRQLGRLPSRVRRPRQQPIAVLQQYGESWVNPHLRLPFGSTGAPVVTVLPDRVGPHHTPRLLTEVMRIPLRSRRRKPVGNRPTLRTARLPASPTASVP